MRTFDYAAELEKLLKPKIVQLIGSIYDKHLIHGIVVSSALSL